MLLSDNYKETDMETPISNAGISLDEWQLKKIEEQDLEIDKAIMELVHKVHKIYECNPLDGDDTMDIADRVLKALDLFNGNLSE